jgi:hypothetical protein
VAVSQQSQKHLSADEAKKMFGPLNGMEWLELDLWAFQELPPAAYNSLRKLYEFHNVPIIDWLDEDLAKLS